MGAFKKLLVSVDTRVERHAAWEQAVRVARHNESHLTLVEVVPEFGWPARWGVTDLEAIREAWLNDKRQRLEALGEEARREGLSVDVRLLTGKTSVELTRLAKELDSDTVFVTAKGPSSRATGSLGTTALRLLRTCPAQVWLVRTDSPLFQNRLVAAVDIAAVDEDHQKLNRAVLDTAGQLAAWFGAELHVAFAWSLFGENLLRSHMAAEEYEELVRNIECEHRKALDELLKKANTPVPATGHLLHGDAWDVFPGFIRESDIELLVIGTVARRGLAGYFIGNTAEHLLDKTPCDILALKPPAGAVGE
ncbi:MAG: universal stress protein E [Pirellulaceae bacterium]|nr:MAG: universal stress protein E [Pirellulaceae bacterium]